jgi:hypothetical protein
MMTRGAIVGEAEGVVRVEEAGDTLSSSSGARNAAVGGNAGLVIEDDGEV